MVQAQAMACGLPVICTTNTGGSEIVDNGVDGYIIPIRNERILMEKLKILYNDRNKLQEMSKNAFLKATNLLSWKNMEKMMDVYSKLLQAKSILNLKSH